MRRISVWLAIMMPVLGLTLIASGCGGTPTTGAGGGTKVTTSDGDKDGKAGGELKLVGYSPSLKGKVTYNGPDSEMTIFEKEPKKDAASCPKMVSMEGWYVKDKSTKGIQYTIVALRPPKGYKMPKWAPEVENPEKAVIELRQPKCMFEPHVLWQHPKQELKIFNDSNPPIAHETNLETLRDKRGQSLPAGASPIVIKPTDLRTSNTEPYAIKCNIHSDFMVGWLFKPDHPYAFVTDENGNYELRGVPVTDPKMMIYVWHEKLPGSTSSQRWKEVGPLDAEKDKPATKDIQIPK